VPANAQPWEMYLRVDPEKKRAWLPFVGGPNMQPVFGAYGAGALVSTSTAAADGLWNEAAKEEPLPQHGNLYLAMRPGPCLKAVNDTVQMLSEAGLLDPATYGQAFQSRLEPYVAGASTIDKLVALAAIEQGQIVFDAQLKCVAEANKE
jgi:hypothetical protein